MIGSPASNSDVVLATVGDGVLLTVKLPGDSAVFVGEKLALAIKTSETNLFDSSGKAIPGLEHKAQ